MQRKSAKLDDCRAEESTVGPPRRRTDANTAPTACFTRQMSCFLWPAPLYTILIGPLVVQMALPATFTTLGALHDADHSWEWSGVLSRLKRAASLELPDWWRDWPVVSPVPAATNNTHKSVLNTLRFCLAPGDITIPFDPAAESVGARLPKDEANHAGVVFHESSYHCSTGTLFADSGGIQNHTVVIEETKALKPILISRERADAMLRGQHCRSDAKDDVQTCSGSSKRELSPSSDVEPNKRARLDVLDERQKRIEGMLECLVERQLTSQPADPFVSELYCSDSDGPSSDYDSSSEKEVLKAPTSAQQIPAKAPPRITTPTPAVAPEGFSFLPSTRVQAPTIPAPDPENVKYAKSCQLLGTPEWDEIGYAEAQKRLHASGVFQPLPVPTSLLAAVKPPSGSYSDLL